MARKDREKKAALTLEQVEAAKKAEKKAKNKVKKAAKKTALLRILKFVSEQEDHGLTGEMLLVTPGQRGGGGGSIMETFKDLFTANTEVQGLELYQDHGMGQGEMRKIVRNLIKKMEPTKRIWVHYDKPSDTYTVMGVGAKAPEGWTGYRPVEVEDVIIV